MGLGSWILTKTRCPGNLERKIIFEGFIALDELGRGPQKKELVFFKDLSLIHPVLWNQDFQDCGFWLKFKTKCITKKRPQLDSLRSRVYMMMTSFLTFDVIVEFCGIFKRLLTGNKNLSTYIDIRKIKVLMLYSKMFIYFLGRWCSIWCVCILKQIFPPTKFQKIKKNCYFLLRCQQTAN